jgi:hypothetical protein
VGAGVGVGVGAFRVYRVRANLRLDVGLLRGIAVHVADVGVVGQRHAEVPRRLDDEVRGVLLRLLRKEELHAAAGVLLPLADDVEELQPALQLIAQLLLLLETRVAPADERVAVKGGVKPLL